MAVAASQGNSPMVLGDKFKYISQQQMSSQISSRPQEGQESDEEITEKHEELKLPLNKIENNLRAMEKQKKQKKQKLQQYDGNQRGSASFNSSQRDPTDNNYVSQEGEAKGHKIVGLDALMPRYFDFQRAVMTRGGRRAATRGDEMPK